jgi:hypothetical protein
MTHRKGYFRRPFEIWNIAEYINDMLHSNPGMRSRIVTGRWVAALATMAKCSKCCSSKVSARASVLLSAYKQKVRLVPSYLFLNKRYVWFLHIFFGGRPRGLVMRSITSPSSKRPLCSLWAGRAGMALNGRHNDLYARCIVRHNDLYARCITMTFMLVVIGLNVQPILTSGMVLYRMDCTG